MGQPHLPIDEQAALGPDYAQRWTQRPAQPDEEAAAGRPWTLPRIDEALDIARALYDHGDAPYVPEILALIRGAEALRERLYGSHRDDVDPQPVFVIRGRDELALAAINAYLDLCRRHHLGEQTEQVGQALTEVTDWQERNADLVKLPDHQHMPMLPHAADMAPLLGRQFARDEAQPFAAEEAGDR